MMTTTMTMMAMVKSQQMLVLCLQALLNNSYLYHMAHGKDFESRGIESKRRGRSVEGSLIDELMIGLTNLTSCVGGIINAVMMSSLFFFLQRTTKGTFSGPELKTKRVL